MMPFWKRKGNGKPVMLAGYNGMQGLGDVVCTTPMCDTGAASVSQMQSVFSQLDDNGKAQFQSSVDAIVSSFNASYSWYSDMIPFNPECCTIQSIGTQADSVVLAMQQYMGVSPIPAPQSGMSLTTMIVLGVVGFLLVSHVANRV